MPVGMGDYSVIKRHQHFADVAAALTPGSV